MGLLHASLLNTFSNAQIVALCDKSTLMTKVCKSIFRKREIRVINELDDLSGLSLDAVYVTTPISSHFPIIKQLLTQNIASNIFTEKTLASSALQAHELCSLQKHFDSITMVGYMKRFSVVFGKAKALLAEGFLGELQSFNAYAYSSDFMGVTKDSKTSASRGGATRDIGCHIIDLVLWLLGDLEVKGVSSSYAIEGAELSVSFDVFTNNGSLGKFDISQRMPNYRMPEFGCIINCQKGQIEVNDDRLRITKSDNTKYIWYRHDLGDNVDFCLGEPEYYRENKEFLESLSNDRKCRTDFSSASKVDSIIDKIKKEIQKSDT